MIEKENCGMLRPYGASPRGQQYRGKIVPMLARLKRVAS